MTEGCILHRFASLLLNYFHFLSTRKKQIVKKKSQNASFFEVFIVVNKKSVNFAPFCGIPVLRSLQLHLIIYIRRQQFICRFKVDRIQEKAKKIRDNKFYV